MSQSFTGEIQVLKRQVFLEATPVTVLGHVSVLLKDFVQLGLICTQSSEFRVQSSI